MNTPVLIQYGEYDETTWPTQGEELYFPLRTREIPTKMITYRKQGHTFPSPHITLLGIKDLEEWLEKYLTPQTDTKIEDLLLPTSLHKIIKNPKESKGWKIDQETRIVIFQEING